MTVIPPLSAGSERFDIALSFVARNDIHRAMELRDLLQSEFSVFLHTDYPQVVGGGEGVMAYSKIFRADTRFAVILLRADWGKTPQTAIEEAAIRDRAQHAEYESFMLVAMEENVERPAWVDPTMYVHPGWLETRARTAEAIRVAAHEARVHVTL